MHGFRHPFPPAAGHSTRLCETLIIVGLLAGLASDAIAQRMGRGDALQSYLHGPTYNMLLLQVSVDRRRSYFSPTKLLGMSRKAIQETDLRNGVLHSYEGVELQNLANNNDLRNAESMEVFLDKGKKRRLSKTDLDSALVVLVADTVDGKKLTGYVPYMLVLRTKNDSTLAFQGVHCIAITHAQ